VTKEDLAAIVADSMLDALKPLSDRLNALDARVQMLTAADQANRDALATVRRDVAAMGDLVAEFEASVKASHGSDAA